jgi:hypothetical protein
MPGNQSLALDFSQLALALSAVSSVAVVAGAVFVVFQLRQNAKLINATIQETKSGIAFSMVERIIDDSFVRRRKNVYDSMKKYGEKNWEGFIGSFDDFEARNYAYMFELFGQMAKDGTIELKTVMSALKWIVVYDWKLMEPMITYLNGQYRLRTNPWGNFEWLAKETEKYLRLQEAGVGPPLPAGPGGG